MNELARAFKGLSFYTRLRGSVFLIEIGACRQMTAFNVWKYLQVFP